MSQGKSWPDCIKKILDSVRTPTNKTHRLQKTSNFIWPVEMVKNMMNQQSVEDLLRLYEQELNRSNKFPKSFWKNIKWITFFCDIQDPEGDKPNEFVEEQKRPEYLLNKKYNEMLKHLNVRVREVFKNIEKERSILYSTKLSYILANSKLQEFLDYPWIFRPNFDIDQKNSKMLTNVCQNCNGKEISVICWSSDGNKLIVCKSDEKDLKSEEVFEAIKGQTGFMNEMEASLGLKKFLDMLFNLPGYEGKLTHYVRLPVPGMSYSKAEIYLAVFTKRCTPENTSILSGYVDKMSSILGIIPAAIIAEFSFNYANIALAKAEERANLIPKWSHGQRINLFGVKSCLINGREQIGKAIQESETIVKNRLKIAGEKINSAISFIDLGYKNVDLLQEMGNYMESLRGGNPRWVDELFYSSDERVPKISLRDVLFQGLKTGFLRLFGISNEEDDERYFNAFQRFFMPRFLNIPQPMETSERKGWSPDRIREKILNMGGPNLFEIRDKLQRVLDEKCTEDSDFWHDLFELTATEVSARTLEDLGNYYVPLDGTNLELVGFKERKSVFVAAIRQAVDEAIVNFIKYGLIPNDINEKSLKIFVKPSSYNQNIVRFSLLFLNVTRKPRKGTSDEEESIANGIKLCNFVLNGLGGGAKSYRSWNINQIEMTHLLTVINIQPEWNYWFGLELNIPGRGYNE